MSGNWRIGEDGLITAKVFRANGIELKDVDGNWYCYGSQNGSLVKVGPAPCSDSDLGNSGSLNTQPISTPIVTSSATDTSTTTNSTVDTTTTTVEETVTTQEPVPNLEIIP
jgi:hypothetical protein